MVARASASSNVLDGIGVRLPLGYPLTDHNILPVISPLLVPTVFIHATPPLSLSPYLCPFRLPSIVPGLSISR